MNEGITSGIMTNFLTAIEFLFTSICEHMITLLQFHMEFPPLLIVTFGLLIVGAVFGYTQRLIKG